MKESTTWIKWKMMPVMSRKYKNRKVTIDGITFDSKAEAAYYNYLKILKKSGEIQGFDMQVRFTLMDKFKHPSDDKKAVRAIAYIPDFVITENDGSKKVVDVKGMKTQVFKLKAKMFMKRYNIPLILAKKKGRGFEHIEM